MRHDVLRTQPAEVDPFTELDEPERERGEGVRRAAEDSGAQPVGDADQPESSTTALIRRSRAAARIVVEAPIEKPSAPIRFASTSGLLLR
jgi:hypothetical protein